MKLFGQRLDEVDYESILRLIDRTVNTKKKEKLTIFSLNLHTFRLLFEDNSFEHIHKKAGVIHADGMGVVYLSRLLGKKVERVNGTELVLMILQANYKCFVVGLNNDLFLRLNHKYPNIVGFYSPSYAKKWSMEETKKILFKIEESGADVVLVGVSNPKAEKWIDENCQKNRAKIWMAVGSAPEILAGGKKRAPKFWQNTGLEWLWRLILEPKRLWKRYVSDAIWLVGFLIRREF